MLQCWPAAQLCQVQQKHTVAVNRGTGCVETDWRLAAERIGSAILQLEPRLLIFVEGVSGNCCPVPTRKAAFWGGALDSAAAAPVRLPPSRLVYSPHVYGPGAWVSRLHGCFKR